MRAAGTAVAATASAVPWDVPGGLEEAAVAPPAAHRPPDLLRAGTLACVLLPGVMFLVEATWGQGPLAPWPRFFLLWIPLGACWLWQWRRLPGLAWAETLGTLATVLAGIAVAASASPLMAAVSLGFLALVPVFGVFRQDWRVSALGALLAALAGGAWCLTLPPGALVYPERLDIAVVQAILLAVMGLLCATLARILARREQEVGAGYAARLEQHRVYRLLADHAEDLICLLDARGAAVYASPSCARLLALPPQGCGGDCWKAVCHPEDVAAARLAFAVAVAGQEHTVTCRLRAAAGGYVWYEAALRPVRAGGGEVQVLCTARNVHARVMLQQQLQFQAFHDVLTQLANRALFQERLQGALHRAGASAQLAVFFVDLDNFKRINDSLGHAAGDQVLVAVAGRLVEAAGGADGVARLGGDEFAVWREGVRGPEEAEALALRLQQALEPPVRVAGQELYLTASIGVACGCGPAPAVERLLREADAAMYLAKSRGKAQFRLFQGEGEALTSDGLRLGSELRQAIEAGELCVHYQPIVRLRDGRLAGFEALVRWQHPRRGLLPPGAFIPLAEENGLIVPIGRWVLEEACRQARAWAAEYRREPPLFMSVNVSARQLLDPAFAEQVQEIVRTTGLDPRTLQLELTETALLAEDAAVGDNLAALRAAGVRIAIDDFGQGYSSLAYLKRFAIDALKIDRSFVARLGSSPQDTAIVRSLLALARELHLTVSGEGVETAEQCRRLDAEHCDQAQGFFFARPMDVAQAAAYLERSGQRALAGRR
jgi:diguanylate cyclase (GGDEF)-like protein/PAS domain S-box-containing protein